jgi:CxxC motif-containing protein
MHYTIVQGNGHLRAELYGRQTVVETQEFIRAVTKEVLKNGDTMVLVSVRNSRPIFKVDQYRIAEQFRRLAAQPKYRVALVADSDELRASHEYIEVLARQQKANVRAFRDEASALDWLGNQSHEKR